ncbi:MAG: Peroxyureidoacrylate/ureidoacrylate amidohydrolase RutB [Chlamydiae bacterium]|nr:Peroxyureidoacrylate/ureidoacrylate amidohydrolase RutB [Chlamydiota bacterium]
MKVLIVVDMQNDFMPGGALGVAGADALVPIINELMKNFSIVVAVKDWHPKGHASFAIWPPHCVQETKGAEFVPGLNVDRFEKVFHKGTDLEIDSYSAFFDNAKARKTGLEEYLKSHQIDAITLVGMATDYCILYSAQDAVKLGFDVTVISDACRAINREPDDEKKAFDSMKSIGAKVI